MPRQTTPLTDAEIKSAKPGTKIHKLHDGQGLLLEIPPKGQKRWRFRYKFEGKELEISLGTYPCQATLKKTDNRILVLKPNSVKINFRKKVKDTHARF